MTADERAHLKALVSDRLRELRGIPCRLDACRACGCDLEARTIGCRTCISRHNRRKRLADREALAREAAYCRERRRKAKA